MKFDKFKIAAAAVLMTALFLTGCQRATRTFGGSMTLDLPQGRKLIEITWKENSLWYLTKEMSASDVAETYEFNESADLGIMEGTVTICEHK